MQVRTVRGMLASRLGEFVSEVSYVSYFWGCCRKLHIEKRAVFCLT